MSKRRLLLDSQDWTPLTEVHRFVSEQTGDSRFADRDLTDRMANGQVRSMRRRVAPRADEPEREVLLPSFWADYKLDSCWSDGLVVVGRKPPPLPPWHLTPLEPASPSSAQLDYNLRVLRGDVFYAWKPDCKKFFGLGVALEGTKESAREKLEKPGRPQTVRWQELREEIVRRCWQKRRFIAPESQTILITELRAWHKRKFKKEPNYDDLRKFVGDAIAILKLAGK
jgi:hypothetical protein